MRRYRRYTQPPIDYVNDSGIFIDIKRVFDNNCINIFTDASTHNKAACAGCIVVIGQLKNNNYIEEYEFCPNTSSNEAELRAILLGIITSIDYVTPNTRINLFSDSLFSIRMIQGARDMIVRNHNLYYNGIRKSGEVKFQESLYGIIEMILRYNLNISFYHQKGHCAVSNNSDMLRALKSFNEINDMNLSTRDLSFMKIISRFNNRVDKRSRNCVKQFMNPNNGMIYQPFDFIPYEYDCDEYDEYISGNNLL